MSKRLIRRREVQSRTGLAVSSLYEKIAAEDFPRPVTLGAKAVAWVEDEIDAWVANRIAERDAKLGAAASEMPPNKKPRRANQRGAIGENDGRA